MLWLDSVAGCEHALVFGGETAGGVSNDLWRFGSMAIGADPVSFAIETAAAVELSWVHDPANAAYEVWRHTAPDFAPGDAAAELLPGSVTIVGGMARFTDSAPPTPAAFYQVRGVACP